jgi:D-sedoheptulose 7-phosphate isomerase
MPENPTLQALYPFLHGERQDAARLDAALLESIDQKAQASIEAKRAFFCAHGAAVAAVAHAIAEVYQRNGKLFAMGNGGSSCDASHIAVEFLHPITAGRPALTAINLVADTAMMTAVGNDVGFAHIFVRQLVAQARRGDALIGISTSGNSDNLLAAFAKARELGLVTIGLSGHDGGRMAAPGVLDYCLVVPSDSIHRIQETHVAIYHILWDLVHTLLADDRGALAATGPAGVTEGTR